VKHKNYKIEDQYFTPPLIYISFAADLPSHIMLAVLQLIPTNDLINSNDFMFYNIMKHSATIDFCFKVTES